MAYAWDHGLDFTVPSTTNDPYWNPIYFSHLINPKYDQTLPSIEVVEKQFSYHQREFNPLWRSGHNIVLKGYWQTERYFAHFRPQIIKHFGLPWKPIKKVVSVHVRRGDYLTIKKGNMFKHPPVKVEWYRQQMRKFPKHVFAFYSDDISWCEEHFHGLGRCMFSPHLDGVPESTIPVIRDLVNMSCCEHHICSASTFSWWGMYLNQNPNKRVIFPKHWITPGWCNLDFSDVIPNWCERA